MPWLLDDEVLQTLNSLELSQFSPTDAQQSNFEARAAAQAPNVQGKTAVIPVQGVLTPQPDMLAFIFGGGNTTYGEIQTALAEANADPAVSDIQLDIDSPGGNASGLFETADAIAASAKPVRAVARTAASAAYALAASADTIVAEGRGSEFGSLGVKTQRRIDGDVVTIASSNAPNKAPDASTVEGVEAIRQELDDVEAMFLEGIAAGRGVPTEKVVADFGKGRTFLAEAALERGMIDSIATAAQPPTAQSGKKKEASRMDLETLRAQHPETYAAAVQIGADKQLDRVAALAVYGKQSGELELALDSIQSGAELTAELTAKFTMAAINKNHQTAHLADGDDVVAAVAGAAEPVVDEATRDAEASQAFSAKFLESRGLSMEA